MLGKPPTKPSQLQQNRLRLLHTHRVDVVLDVGANAGQFATQLRDMGFDGKIVSFEPTSSAFAVLERYAKHDPRWQAVRLAMGDSNHQAVINVSANSQSSSLLDMKPRHLDACAESKYVGGELVEVRTLDSTIDQYVGPTERAYLKIDTQGYEKHVLEGATRSLGREIVGVQLESALIELYQGETLFDEIIAWMKQHGFSLMSIEPGFTDAKSGQMLQTDLIFFR